MKINDCKGCNLYKVCYAIHVLRVSNKGCPCTICLVKMMCNQRCNEFMKFRLQYKSKKETICNECRTYSYCAIIRIKHKQLCPCSMCPTKKRCENACDIFEDYYKEFLI